MSDEEYGTCPYNKQHRILKLRMPSHIIKCRKNYKGPKLEMCAYNATHLVTPGTMKQHLEACLDRHTFNKPLYDKIANEYTTS